MLEITPTVEATGVAKRFGATKALDGLDITMRPGQVMALLGPNGAGKTTFVNLLATLLRPDEGSLRICGVDVARDPASVRRIVALAGQYAAVEPTMTGRENVEMVARLFGQPRGTAQQNAADVLDRMGLSDAADRMVRTYSGGMRRRLDIAASLVGRPSVIFLDEPSAGLDPQSRLTIWGVVEDLAASGVTVFLTTQYLKEAERLAETIAILDGGRVIAEGTAAELKQRVRRRCARYSTQPTRAGC